MKQLFSKDLTDAFMIISIVLGAEAILAYALINKLPGTDFMVGAVYGAFLTIVNFRFGTSKSSQDKTNIIQGMANKGAV